MANELPTESFKRANCGPSLVRDLAFVLRCSLAATVAFLLASEIGLQYPVWASVSAAMVSQEKVQDTSTAALWRVAGTVAGVVVAGLSGSLLDLLSAPTAIQIACAVGLCAVTVRWKPELKVAMATAPIVFLTRHGQEALLIPGFWRGVEVLIGGLTGASLHLLAEFVIGRLPAPLDIRTLQSVDPCDPQGGPAGAPHPGQTGEVPTAEASAKSART